MKLIQQGEKAKKPHDLLAYLTKTMKTFIIGDIHGGYKALIQCLERSHFDYDNDILICLGDVVDGWSETPQCIEELLKIKNLIYIIGNHDCNHKDTEYLTNKGWLRYQEISVSDMLAQFDGNNITYSKPLKRIEGYASKLIKIEGNQTCQIVTHGHNVIMDGEKIKAKELLDLSIPESSIKICGTEINKEDIKVSDKLLRLLVWIICDGTIVFKGQNLSRIQFKLSKIRKIESLQILLKDMGIPFTIRKANKSAYNKLQPYYICIYTKEARKITSYIFDKKEIPSWFANLNKKQCKVVLETLSETDGHITLSNKVTVSSINKKNLDIINLMCVNNNVESYVSRRGKSGFKNGKTQYSLTYWLNKKATRNFKLDIREISYNNKVYCFQMLKGNIVTRHNGKVAFTGNCWVDDWFETGHAPMIWTEQGGRATIEAYKKHGDLLVKHRHFFYKSRVVFIDKEQRLFVHGGFDVNIPIKEQTREDLTWSRELWDNRHSYKEVKGYKEIYVGHTSIWRFSHFPWWNGNVCFMDTGGGWEGKLSIMDIDTKKFWQSDVVSQLYSNELGRGI